MNCACTCQRHSASRLPGIVRSRPCRDRLGHRHGLLGTPRAAEVQVPLPVPQKEMRHISLESLSLDILGQCQFVGARHPPAPSRTPTPSPDRGLSPSPAAAPAGPSTYRGRRGRHTPGRQAGRSSPAGLRTCAVKRLSEPVQETAGLATARRTTAPRLRTRAGPASSSVTVKPRPTAAAQHLPPLLASPLPARPQQAGSRHRDNAGPPLTRAS